MNAQKIIEDKKKMIVKQGDIFFFDFGTREDCEIYGVRPAIIIQNNIGNRFSPNVTVVPLTCYANKKTKKLPIHMQLTIDDIISKKQNSFQHSIVLCEQIITLSKNRILHNEPHATVKSHIINEIREKINIQINQL